MAPKQGLSGFHCPHCGVFSAQAFHGLVYIGHFTTLTGAQVIICAHCGKYGMWFNGRLYHPGDSTAPTRHADLPVSCLRDFEEAREIVAVSPRAAAALLRVVVETLTKGLVPSAKSLNDAIAILVSKGLPPEVQQALDVCRVVGNRAVHVGQIDATDTREIASQLFDLVTFIVDDRISRPAQIAKLYGALPTDARDAISKREMKAR